LNLPLQQVMIRAIPDDQKDNIGKDPFHRDGRPYQMIRTLVVDQSAEHAHYRAGMAES
jgi:hypothetical protein